MIICFKLPTNRWSALHCSCVKGYRDVTQYILSLGVDVNETTNKQVTPLMLAAYSGDIETVEILLKKHASCDDESDSGLMYIYICSSLT